MGGNATKELGTMRLNKNEYNNCVKSILNELIKSSNLYKPFNGIDYLNEQNKSAFNIVVPKSVNDKKDFGYIDMLSSISINEFNRIINHNENINIVGVSNNNFSYALQVKIDDSWSKPFQLNYMYSDEKDFIFKSKYLEYNDINNLIGIIAKKNGLVMSNTGLYIDIKLNKNKNDNLYYRVPITKNYNEAIEFLGFDSKKHESGFESFSDILQFIGNSKYFNHKYFKTFDNKSSNIRNKRPLFSKAIKYFSENQFKNSDKLISREDINRNFSNFNNTLCKKRKKIRSNEILKKRIGFKKICEILKTDLGIKIKDNCETDAKNKIVKKSDYKLIINSIKKIDNIEKKSFKMNKSEFRALISDYLKENINDILNIKIINNTNAIKVKMAM